MSIGFLKTQSLLSTNSKSFTKSMSLLNEKKQYELVKKYANGDWEGSIHENLCGEYLSWTGKKKTSVKLLVIVFFFSFFFSYFLSLQALLGAHS